MKTGLRGFLQIQKLMQGLVLAAIFWASPALGCAVCGVPVDRTSDVFVASTVVLSLVPLLAMGGFVAFLWKKHTATKLPPDDGYESLPPRES